MTMEYAEIIPPNGRVKDTLRLLDSLGGQHVEKTVDGHQIITAPAWLVEKYLAATQAEKPKPRRTRAKREIEES